MIVNQLLVCNFAASKSKKKSDFNRYNNENSQNR